TVELFAVIDRDGNLVQYEIAESSGHSLLDREVEKLVQRASPFPKVPSEVRGNTIKFTVPIVFTIGN
ncbi:MAG: energy transducer TonB, partial [Pseudomonadota bacterium]